MADIERREDWRAKSAGLRVFPHGRRAVKDRLKSRTLWCGAVVLVGILLIGFAHGAILRQVAFFLMIEDSLQPAAAIVALIGETPFREIEAAKLYRAGLAPQIVIVRTAPSAGSEALHELGINALQSWEISREVLIRQGVSARSIITPTMETGGTLEELQAVYSAMTSKDAAVILVTSKFHTRRTRLTWSYVSAGRSQPIVRSASGAFDPNQWWHKRSSVMYVIHEYLGLIYYYARFGIAP